MRLLVKKDIIAYIIILLSVFPPFLSIIFAITSFAIPAYIVSIISSLLLILLFFKRRIVYRLDKAKFFFFLFIIWILYGGTYSESVIACQNKIIVICYIIIVPVLILEICFALTHFTHEAIILFERKIYNCSIWLIWLLALLILLFRQYESDRLILPGLANPIWLTRLIGMLLLVVYYYKTARGVGYLFTILVAFIILVLVGSRTPCIALLICMGLIRFSTYSFKKNFYIILLAVFLSLIAIACFSDSYLFDTNFYSLYARFDFISSIQNASFNFWKGLGTGSFGLFYYNEDIEAYPHNCFLEYFVENGIIGVFLFSLLLFFFFRNYKLSLINLLVIYTFINALASGDIVGNNLFFIFIYLSFIINFTYGKKNIICTS